MNRTIKLLSMSLGLVPALVAALSSGCGPEQDFATAKCPPDGTSLTYVNFGEAFLARRCQICHAQNVDDRHGAPDKYTFDSPAEVHKWIDRIYDRSAGDNTSMPPGPEDPPLTERDDLAEWLACGAP